MKPNQKEMQKMKDDVLAEFYLKPDGKGVAVTLFSQSDLSLDAMADALSELADRLRVEATKGDDNGGN